MRQAPTHPHPETNPHPHGGYPAPHSRLMLAAGPAAVTPELIVVLGATAGKALPGSSFRVGEVRGTVLEREMYGRPDVGNG